MAYRNHQSHVQRKYNGFKQGAPTTKNATPAPPQKNKNKKTLKLYCVLQIVLDVSGSGVPILLELGHLDSKPFHSRQPEASAPNPEGSEFWCSPARRLFIHSSKRSKPREKKKHHRQPEMRISRALGIARYHALEVSVLHRCRTNSNTFVSTLLETIKMIFRSNLLVFSMQPAQSSYLIVTTTVILSFFAMKVK